MDAFEKAKAKYQKERERKDKYEPRVSHEEPQPMIEPKVEQVPVLLVPKEKTKSQDAIIRVVVELPKGEISFSLRKRAVLANMPANKINVNEFRNAVMRGLEPLCGRVE